MRAVFFGTPALAVPSLEALHEVAEVVRVYCQPDRPAGRGMKLKPPPVKVRASELGLAVEQPRSVKSEAFAESLRELRVDVGVVVAYGRILPRAVLDAPRRGCVNVHASLLPRWRGAAPIQWAIVHGDAETGVCLMQMDEGMDTGPVIACERTSIGKDESAAELGERLARMGADLLRRRLPDWVDGTLEATPQDDSAATLAPRLEKEHGRIDWSASARAVHDRVRGLSPWPGAFTEVDGRGVKIHRTQLREESGERGEPGTLLSVDPEGIEVSCGRGSVAILELQMEGKRRLSAREFLAGHRWQPGLTLG